MEYHFEKYKAVFSKKKMLINELRTPVTMIEKRNGDPSLKAF